MACWSCERPEGNSFFCQACRALQPPRPARTHFEVLGVARRFSQDPSDLERRFKDLQRKLHPDRFARADARVRRFAVEHATAVNEAYRTLRHAFRRAEYLLHLGGLELDVDKRGTGARTPAMDPAFLAEMMELQEMLAEAKAEGRTDDVRRMASDVARRRDREMLEVDRDFGDPAGGGDLDRIGRRLAAIRYFDRFLGTAEGLRET
jgi:molecular chaperone HscB